ncbi:MAG: transcriptional repressor [Campylobacter sp.]|nr:transcriptional repressor [Campylobacter sp.]
MKTDEILTKYAIAITPLREQILQILLDTKTPIDCETLIKQTGANKTTIYRNLALFEEKGLLTHTQNARKAFYELNDASKAYFICDICHKMEQIDMPKISHKHIKTITVQGICDECSE